MDELNELSNLFTQLQIAEFYETNNPLIDEFLRQKRHYISKILDVINKKKDLYRHINHSKKKQLQYTKNLIIYMDTLDILNHRLNFVYSRYKITPSKEIIELTKKINISKLLEKETKEALKPDDTYIENLLLAYSSTIKGINGAGLTDLRFAKEKQLINDLNKVDFVSFGGKLKERIKHSPNKKKYQEEFKRLSNVIISKLSN